MIEITARRDGYRTALSRTIYTLSDSVLNIRFQGIDPSTITAADYRLGRAPDGVYKSLGSGITITDDIMLIAISENDLLTTGTKRHVLKITDDTGSYKVNMNIGRLQVQN